VVNVALLQPGANETVPARIASLSLDPDNGGDPIIHVYMNEIG
jgi:hypothetical protein